jgi:hypothetical protein
VTVTGGIRYEAQMLPAPFGTVTHNIAPRLGIAWQPNGLGTWVFRAGAGLFYDRFPLAFLNDAIQKDGVHGFEQYAESVEAARIFAFSLGGTLAAPVPGIVPSIYRPQAAFASNSTYARKVTAGGERALDANTTLNVEYMNIAGFHLPRLRNVAFAAGIPPRTKRQLALSGCKRNLTPSTHKGGDLSHRIYRRRGLRRCERFQ